MNDHSLQSAIDGLIETGRQFHGFRWSLGTSSNYSVVLGKDPLRLLLTASGKDKGRLTPNDFVQVDAEGRLLEASQEKPSAETWLHLVLAQQPGVGSVLHTHSVWGTILSDRFAADGGFWIDGYEMLKGLAGITTHQTRHWVTIFENTQDIPALSWEVSARLRDAANPLRHGFLIKKHGLYTWGRDLEEARRHIEIFEFLFEVLARQL